LIVVNSVMSGFSTKLRERLHGLMSDVVMESIQQDGFADPAAKIERIRNSPIGSKIAAMTPAIEILGLIKMDYEGAQMAPRAVHLIGIDPEGRTKVGGFAEYLVDPANRQKPSFEVRGAAKGWHDFKYPDIMPKQLPLQ